MIILFNPPIREYVYCQEFDETTFYYYDDKIQILTSKKNKNKSVDLIQLKINKYKDTLVSLEEFPLVGDTLYNKLIKNNIKILIKTKNYNKNIYSEFVFAYKHEKKINIFNIARAGWETYYYFDQLKNLNLFNFFINNYAKDPNYKINFFHSLKLKTFTEINFEGVFIEKIPQLSTISLKTVFTHILTFLELLSIYVDGLLNFEVYLQISNNSNREWLNISKMDKLDLLKFLDKLSMNNICVRIIYNNVNDFISKDSIFFLIKTSYVSYHEYYLKNYQYFLK